MFIKFTARRPRESLPIPASGMFFLHVTHRIQSPAANTAGLHTGPDGVREAA